MRRDLNIIRMSGTFVLYAYIIRCEQMFVNGFGRKMQTFVRDLLLFTHTCPVTEFAVASHLNTANFCCHHVFLRHFRFQKCLPMNSNRGFACRSRHLLLLVSTLFPMKNDYPLPSGQNMNPMCFFVSAVINFSYKNLNTLGI